MISFHDQNYYIIILQLYKYVINDFLSLLFPKIHRTVLINKSFLNKLTSNEKLQAISLYQNK